MRAFRFLLPLITSINAFVRPSIQKTRASLKLSASPPRSPWDELKDRFNNGFTSEKYSEEKSGLNYRPTFEIKEDDSTDLNKQRVESIKAFVIGALSGSLSLAPIAYFHYSDYNMAQFELSTDMGAIQAGLFAITYRYVSRKGDNNPMLSQGAVGAFALVRTLSNIQAPTTCTAFPLTCGQPLSYFNWAMIYQAALYGVESFVMFGVTAVAVELFYKFKFLQRFD